MFSRPTETARPTIVNSQASCVQETRNKENRWINGCQRQKTVDLGGAAAVVKQDQGRKNQHFDLFQLFLLTVGSVGRSFRALCQQDVGNDGKQEKGLN